MLNLYYADDIRGDWKPHPMNPVVKLNPKTARPAGPVITYDGSLYRMSMDSYPVYGRQVFAYRITELSPTRYAETLASDKPIVNRGESGWNGAGMHHVDLHQLGDRWLAVVDGRDR